MRIKVKMDKGEGVAAIGLTAVILKSLYWIIMFFLLIYIGRYVLDYFTENTILGRAVIHKLECNQPQRGNKYERSNRA